MAASKKSVASVTKRPISRKRIRANRRNAKKSTGPKTEQGKRIVSRNALVHGLRSQHFPILPYENSAEYREFEEAMERDCYPQGILQRQVVFQITQISWKLRRIPAIEAALLKYHNLRGHKEFEEGKEDGTFRENDQLAEPTVPELIAMQFADPNDRPYERLEMYRMRLERGLDSATRMLERLRKETAGAEINHHQKVQYEIADMNRLIQQHRESVAQRSAAERAAAENAPKEASQPDSNSKPAKEMQSDNCAITIKATSSLSPSPGTPGEGRGEGLSARSQEKTPTPTLPRSTGRGSSDDVVQCPPLTSQRKPGL